MNLQHHRVPAFSGSNQVHQDYITLEITNHVLHTSIQGICFSSTPGFFCLSDASHSLLQRVLLDFLETLALLVSQVLL